MNNFENFTIETPKRNKPEALDERWFERFEKIASFSDTEYLNDSKKERDSQKQNFLDGKIENPNLNYPEIKKINLKEKEGQLIELKRDIIDNEPDPILKQIYRWKLNEKIAELRMLKSTENGNDKKFFRYSKFVYGLPKKEIFDYSLEQIRPVIEYGLKSPYLDISSAARELQEELFNRYHPLENSIDQPEINISKLLVQNNEKEYGSDEIKTAFEGALEIFQVQGFKIIVDQEGKLKAINVSQEFKKVNIPKERKLKIKTLQSRMMHEIGTHASRRTRGERTKLKLLGLGLDRYIKGEEGIATYYEQQIEGASNYSGLDYYLAISLATGIDGKKRNFRQVFEILKKLYLIRSKEKDSKKALKKSETKSWNDCVRIFRGTTCKTPGACFTKDIVYREGNIGVWNIAKNNPNEIRRFSIGKYDPSNSRHIWILDQLDISDDDLDALEK